VLWRLRYKLSFRDLAEMFLERGFVFSHEAVRDWEARFAPLLACNGYPAHPRINWAKWATQRDGRRADGTVQSGAGRSPRRIP